MGTYAFQSAADRVGAWHTRLTRLAWLTVCLRAHNLANAARENELDWIERGILLGALGGLVGFFISGLVHYNWGDSEVIMIFYFLTGLVLALYRNTQLSPQAVAS